MLLTFFSFPYCLAWFSCSNCTVQSSLPVFMMPFWLLNFCAAIKAALMWMFRLSYWCLLSVEEYIYYNLNQGWKSIFHNCILQVLSSNLVISSKSFHVLNPVMPFFFVTFWSIYVTFHVYRLGDTAASPWRRWIPCSHRWIHECCLHSLAPRHCAGISWSLL